MAKRIRAKSVPFSVKQAIWAMPCAVCGSPYNINVDHIVPVAAGGSSDRLNLQPLCHACNHVKGHRLSNAEIAERIRKKGLSHFALAVYQEATRFHNAYEGPSLKAWLAASAAHREEARNLYEAFLSRWANA